MTIELHGGPSDGLTFDWEVKPPADGPPPAFAVPMFRDGKPWRAVYHHDVKRGRYVYQYSEPGRVPR